MKKLNFYILLSQKKWKSKMTTARQCRAVVIFDFHLLESGLARINWIRAVDKICVEQLICCQKCWANDCRAIAFWAVHPHSSKQEKKIKQRRKQHFWQIKRQSNSNEQKSTQPKVKLYDFELGLWLKLTKIKPNVLKCVHWNKLSHCINVFINWCPLLLWLGIILII